MRSTSSRLLLFLTLACSAALGQYTNIDTQIKGSRWPAWGVDSGAANAYVVTTVAPLGPALKTGSQIAFIATHANTGASTVAVDGGAAIDIKKNVSTALASGDIPLNSVVIGWYDGANFQMTSPAPASVGTIFYQTVQQGGSDQTQEPKLNLVDGTNVTVSCADNPGVSTDCTVASSGGGGSSSAYYTNNGAGTGANLLAQYVQTSYPQTTIKTLTTANASNGRSVPLVGLVIAGAGTSGLAQVQFSGTANCVFDNTTGTAINQGATVYASTTTAGNCQTRGSNQTQPNENPEGNIVVGTVHTTVASVTSGTAYAIDLQPITKFTTSNAGQSGFVANLLGQPAGSNFATILSFYGDSQSPGSTASPYLRSDSGFRTGQGNVASFCDYMADTGAGASTHDPGLDCLTHGNGAPPVYMYRKNVSDYNVPDVRAINGTVSVGQTGHWRVGNTGGVYIWTVNGNSSSFTPENDNAGHYLFFEFIAPSAGGPFTFTWPSGFVNPPAISLSSGNAAVTAVFLFDGTNYNCVAGCSGGAGTGTVTTTGSPASPHLTRFSGATAITNATAHDAFADWNCPDSSGSGTVQSCSTPLTFTPATGDCIIYQTTTANTSDLTVNVNSSSAVHVRKWLGAAVLASGDMPANKPVQMCYDGTYWETMTIGNDPTSGGSCGTLTGDVTSVACATTIANNAVNSAKTAVVNTRRTCMIVVGADNGSALANADLGPQNELCQFDEAVTLVEIGVSADSGTATPSVLLEKRHCSTFTAGACSAWTLSDSLSGALAVASSLVPVCALSSTSGTCIDGTTSSSSITLTNTSFAAGDWIELKSGTAGGTAKRVTVKATMTVN